MDELLRENDEYFSGGMGEMRNCSGEVILRENIFPEVVEDMRNNSPEMD